MVAPLPRWTSGLRQVRTLASTGSRVVSPAATDSEEGCFMSWCFASTALGLTHGGHITNSNASPWQESFGTETGGQGCTCRRTGKVPELLLRLVVDVIRVQVNWPLKHLKCMTQLNGDLRSLRRHEPRYNYQRALTKTSTISSAGTCKT